MTTPQPGAAANADAIINSLLGQAGAGDLGSLGGGAAIGEDMVGWYVRDDDEDKESARFRDPTDPEKHFGMGMDKISAEKATLAIVTWDDQRLKQLGDRLLDAGMVPEDYSRDDLEQAWAGLVQRAAKHHAADPNTTLTPWDMIDLYGTPNSGPSAKDVVTKNISLSDNNEARRVLNQMLSAELGRRATQEEIDDFQAALNDAQRRAPVVTSQTYDRDSNTRTTTNTGGLDVGGFTDKYAHGSTFDAEYGKYQAATTYANALFDAIKAPV